MIVPKPLNGTPQTNARTMNPMSMTKESKAQAVPKSGMTLSGMNEYERIPRNANPSTVR